MTESQLQQLKSDAQETLANIDFDKLTKDTFLLAGASMGILSNPDMPAQAPMMAQERVDFVPQSQIDELLQDLLRTFIAYSSEKSEYQVTPSDTNKADMLRSLDAMLDMQRQIFNLLWRDADMAEEREQIKNFFKSYAQKYNL